MLPPRLLRLLPLQLRRRSLRPFSAFVPSASGSADENPQCPGCGVHMQSSTPTLPGFFTRPSPKSPLYHARRRGLLSLLPSTSTTPLTLPDLPAGEQSTAAPVTTTEAAAATSTTLKPVVCARCHSLRHYGHVKDPSCEPLLPDFDFVAALGGRIASPDGARTVVLLLADAADFDGSFPRSVARLIASTDDVNAYNFRRGMPGNVPRALLVLTKLDLLPAKDVSPGRVENWVRSQANASGAGRFAGVHLVSATHGWGIRGLIDHVQELVGVRGNVWAVGARNVGKSTLLNAMASRSDAQGKLTEAPVPGTTLGVVKVEGVLHGQAKLFDTPGLLHQHQITSRLTPEEIKIVLCRKELRPRTYRIMAGHSIHIGGLMRLDIEELSVSSIYVTVWASSLIPLHMGKTENAPRLKDEHFGLQLQPPAGQERVKELGRWVRKEITVWGDSWNAKAVDITIAGLGWCAVGLKGEAKLGAWTYEGVGVDARSALIHRKASIFEEAGFTVSKIVSNADSKANKVKKNNACKQNKAGQSGRSELMSSELPEHEMVLATS